MRLRSCWFAFGEPEKYKNMIMIRLLLFEAAIA